MCAQQIDSNVSHDDVSGFQQHNLSGQHCCSLQALIDRPDEVRKVENFKRFQLTDYKIDIPKLAKKKALKAALEKDGKQ